MIFPRHDPLKTGISTTPVRPTLVSGLTYGVPPPTTIVIEVLIPVPTSISRANAVSLIVIGSVYFSPSSRRQFCSLNDVTDAGS
ncbi:MAG: hypothetical protein U0528_01595 [Anaerolineae bacterium]